MLFAAASGKGKMEFVKKMLERIGRAFALCFSASFVLSKIERKKGWVEGHQPGFYERELKRPLDLGLSLMAVIFLWPVMLVTAILVRSKLGVPVLFKQERPGLGGVTFTIRKYRTMLNSQGDDGAQLPDAERLTDFGKKLRSTSLDELPELFNIIKGDMSIVGPRPLLVEYLPRYNEQQHHRHDVRPGLTGLAQVSGRNELSWTEKFEDDVEYAKNITFFGDLRILMKTARIVFEKKGISSSTSETMEVFTGNEK